MKKRNAHPPHLAHLFCGSFGSNDMMMKPAIAGRVENIMNHMRRFFHRLVMSPMRTKYRTEVTLLGMSRRMTCKLAAETVSVGLLLAEI